MLKIAKKGIATNSNIPMSMFLQANDVKLWYFKLFDLTEVIVRNF